MVTRLRARSCASLALTRAMYSSIIVTRIVVYPIRLKALDGASTVRASWFYQLVILNLVFFSNTRILIVGYANDVSNNLVFEIDVVSKELFYLFFQEGAEHYVRINRSINHWILSENVLS